MTLEMAVFCFCIGSGSCFGKWYFICSVGKLYYTKSTRTIAAAQPVIWGAIMTFKFIGVSLST